MFPVLLNGIGQQALLLILVGTSLLGAWVTWAYRIETNRINLDTVGTAAPLVNDVPAPAMAVSR